MIKKILFATMLIISSISITKAQQLNYQGIARNANGVAISFQDVSIRLSIRDLIALGSTLYSETRLVRTNQFGLINVVIGSPGAINTIGSIGAINWAGSSKFLQVEIDPLGGTSFQNAGTSQLQSVPYAFFANAAYPVGPAGGDLLGSTYPNPIIAPLVVTTTKLADSAVITRKIADMAVTTEKIMDSAVTTTKLRDKGVTTEKIADSAITNEKIKNGAITNEKITDGTIQNIKLVNSIITLNGLVLNLGGSQSFVVDSAGTDVNIASANSIHRFNFPNASIINRGLITTTTQTIGGNKIFNNNITAASFIRNGGIAAQFLKADGSVDNKIYLSANQPIIFTATGDATGISTSSGTAPVLPLTLATVNSTIGTFGTNILIPAITVNNKGLVTNIITNPIPTATSTTLGLLTATDWNTFNSKQNVIPLGTTAQYFRGDLSLSNFQTDIRAQLSAGTNITYTNGQFSITNNSVTLNNLPLTLGGSQTFATGTGGIDFNISSLGTVHTFNIPTASVFARGLLTSTDYTNFNAAYSNRITSLTTNGPNGVATLGSNVLNIPTYALPAATGTTLGGTIIGANISNSGGTISLNNTNITNALGSQSGNLIFASPNGSAGTPVFRPLVVADIPPSLNQNTTGNAATVTTNANLTGPVTSFGNATSIAAGTITNTMLANSAVANLSNINSGDNAVNTLYSGLVTNATHTGDATGSTALTLATVNSNIGSFGTSTSVPSITVNAKGLVTAASTTSIPTATTSVTGLLTSTNWNTFNSKQNAISLGNTSQYFRGDLSLSNFETDVRNQLSAGTNISFLNGIITNTSPMTFPSSGIALSNGTSWAGSITNNSSNWNTAFDDRFKWDGGSTGLISATGRTSLGGTTVGSNFFTLSNPNAIAFPRINLDNSISTLSATAFRIAIGAGTSSTNGTVTSVDFSVPTGLTISGNPITTSSSLALGFSPGYSIPTDAIQTDWTTAFNDRLKWDGGSTGLIAATGRTSLGGTTVGSNFFTLTNPGSISFTRINADNTVTTLSAVDFRTAIGVTGSSNTWNTSGNSSLVDGTNFLGTVDQRALRFRVFNLWAGEINPATTNSSFGIGAGQNNSSSINTNNTAFGFGALNLNTFEGVDNTAIGQGALILNTTGDNNTAVGQSALANTIGTSNTAVGQAAMQTNTGGFNNTAMGKDALFFNLIGENNTAIGHWAARLTTGSTNTAIGQNSLNANTTGSDNTAIGYGANVISSNLTNATAIGASALVNADNTVQLGNTLVTKVNTSGTMNANKFIGNSSGTSLTHNSAKINNVALPVISGNDVAGFITFTTGATPDGIGDFVTVTFGSPYTLTSPIVLIQPVINTGTRGITTSIYCLPSATTLTTFVISTGIALLANTDYQIAYHVLGR